MSQGPIGVFDSGVGGLSVLREIRRELPCEDLLYIADSAHAPYGDKPVEFIEARAATIADWLLEHGAKAIVVACNTASGAAAQRLRARIGQPVVAMEPAVKPAVACSRSGVVGVLATRQTLASHSFHTLVQRVGQGADILAQPCPGLVEQVERGEFDSALTRALVTQYVTPLLAQGADTLVLGCTHYPHLRPLIESCAGERVSILDSGAAVARQVRRRLSAANLLAPDTQIGRVRVWTTRDMEANRALLARLWPESLHAFKVLSLSNTLAVTASFAEWPVEKRSDSSLQLKR